jgi:tetratricopeptide (TPR) repeat protein
VTACDNDDLEGAIELFGKIISQAPDRWEAYYARAWARVRSEDQAPGAAEEDLKKALELGGPCAADAAALLGQLKFETGEYVEAFSYYLQSFGWTSRPEVSDRGLVESLSGALSALEEDTGGAKQIEECIRLKQILFSRTLPTKVQSALEAEILATEARLEESLGDRAAADSSFQRLSAIMPNHPAVVNHRKNETPGAEAPFNPLVEPTFASIGGHEHPETFQAKMKHLFEQYFGPGDLESMRQRAERMKDDPLRLILMSGPSGCGKTYIVRAFAGEYRKRYKQQLQIVEVRLNEVFGRYVGESERALSKLFDRAIRSQPSILFVDEVDALGGARDGAQDWRATQTSHFLQEIDRLRERQAFVLMIGCTNRIWEVELALIRRFDHIISVEMPTHEVRREIFVAKFNDLPEMLRPRDADLDLLARESHGLTAGDIANVIRRAKDGLPLASNSRDVVRLTGEDLERALREYGKPMHVRDWVRRAADGLRRARHDELAEELISKYQPYTQIPITSLSTEIPAPAMIPITEVAWDERPVYDFSFFRLLNRRPQ